MEALGLALATWGRAFGWIYVVGILTKTTIIILSMVKDDKEVDKDVLINWFKWWKNRDRM